MLLVTKTWTLLGCVATIFLIATLAVSSGTAQCSCPESCTCYLQEGTIDCSNQDLQAIPSNINCAWSNITKIDLSGNRISSIPGHAFSRVYRLERLYLYSNAIASLDRNSFQNLTRLRYLFLDSNRLTSLPDEVFYPLGNLYSLLLYSNELSYLSVNIFSTLRKLFRLALHDNSLTVLDVRWFIGLTSLEQLYLNDNQIIGLSNSPFTFLTELKRLYLQRNNLTRLTRFDFVGANRLTLLDLSFNRISVVDDDTFLLHGTIVHLFLHNNLISRVTRLTFAGILDLQVINLQSNQLIYISEGAFFRNRELREMYLSGNLLEELTTNILAGLQSLQTLAVARNRLTYLQNNTFLHTPLLQALDFSRNNISCIEDGTFSGIPLLLYLNLGRNSLFKLPENIFQSLSNLYYLLLNVNRLREIKSGLFRNLNLLIQLSLYENGISYIAEGALDRTGNLFYFQWNYHEYNFSTGNSLVCDCSNEWLYKYVREKRYFSTTIYCAEPPHLKGREIHSLSVEDFACGLLSEDTLRIEVEPPGDSHVVSEGGCLRLICKSTPRGRTSWSRVGHHSISRALGRSCLKYTPCVHTIEESELLIINASKADEGTYICTASLKNVTCSAAFHISIGVAPDVRLRPTDQYLPWPGETAYFRVHMSGKPHPSVEWYHEKHHGISAGIEEVSTRIVEGTRHIISHHGSLVIMDTTIDDVGTYRAIISNGAGRETLTASLEFFFSSPCRRECENGGTCYQTHYCFCRPGFLGRHCEINNGGSITTEEPTSTNDVVSGSGSGYYGYSGYVDTESGDDQYIDQESGDDDGSAHLGNTQGYSENTPGDYTPGYSENTPGDSTPGYSDNTSEDSADTPGDYNSGYELGDRELLGSAEGSGESKGESDRKRRENNDRISSYVANSFPWILAGQPLQWHQERQMDLQFDYKQIPTSSEIDRVRMSSRKDGQRTSKKKSTKRHLHKFDKDKKERDKVTDEELDKFLEDEIKWNLLDPIDDEAKKTQEEEKKAEDEEEEMADRERWIREIENSAVDSTPRTLDEQEQYEENRKLLLELGLAEEWNEDQTGSEDEANNYSPPVVMGLKLLPSTGTLPNVQTNEAFRHIHED